MWRWVLGLGIVGALGAGAVWASQAPAPLHGRVVVLGLDGLEYDVLHRYAHVLPHFSKLLAEGAHAEMTVTTPIMSPILWTTMASGYPVDVHGVGGWTNSAGKSYTGADVRVSRIWDVLTGEGRASVVAGWLMSWPASIIRGNLLSDRFVWSVPMARGDGQQKVDEAPEVTTYPDALGTLANTLIPDDAWLAASPLAYQVAEYGGPSHPLRRDETHLRVFEALWPAAHADFGAIYLNGADQVSHLYYPFCEPDVQRKIRLDPTAHKTQVDELLRRHPTRNMPPWGETGLTAEHLGEAARWVPDYYAYLDTVLGRVEAVLEPDTTLIVVSDHGFQPSTTKPLVEGQHRGVAVFAAIGPHVKAGATGKIHVFDVAPTLYALLGVPAAADMPGKVAEDLVDVHALPPVPTRVLRRGEIDVGSGASAGDAALRAQLEALGYLDDLVQRHEN